MAFSGNFMCTSFKVELLQGKHDFTNGQDVYNIALYTNSATFTASTTDYTSSNEVSNSGSYSAGGGALTNVTPTSASTTAFTDFADKTFTSATITARGALIYNTQTGGGSGTTAFACINTKRRFTGCELSTEYFKKMNDILKKNNEKKTNN